MEITKLFGKNRIRFVNCLATAMFMMSMPSNAESEQSLKKADVEFYQNDNVTNQIPYFDNRFRIDSELDEITLIFYRKSGSVPIILVRPDGSKIRISNIDHKKVQWYDDSTFDMIKIKKPMPGPWQAIGDILPNSQILVVSDVTIKVKPLPEIVFSGETLKVEGHLYNDEKAIESSNFRDVVKLDINFYSTNNASYENFGADAVKVTSFRDDGRGLDEYANDNTFTGEFVLNFAPGEWQPVYLVKLPMVTRELRQRNLMLHPTPVSLDVQTSDNEETPHILNVTIDPTYANPDSMVFQGKVTFPDRQVEPFSIMEEAGASRTKEVTYTEPGLYRVNVSAFGKTIDGREFRLVVPEFTFNVEAQSLEVIDGVSPENTTEEDSVSEALEAAKLAEEQLLLSHEQALEEQKQQEQQNLIMIAAGNGIIIVLAIVAFVVIGKVKKKRKK